MKRLTLESAARNEHFSDELKLTFVAVVVGLLLAVAGNRLDDVIKWFFATSTPIPARDLATAAVCSLLAFFIGWRFGIKNFRERFLRSKAIISPLDTARAYRAVVLTLSRAFETTRDGNPSQLEMAERAIADIKRKLAVSGAPPDAGRELLRFICETKDSTQNALAGHPWQQTLRLVLHHYDRLQVMSFVLSPEVARPRDNPTPPGVSLGTQFDLFVEILMALAPAGLIVLPSRLPRQPLTGLVDHTDYNAVYLQLRDACDAALTAAQCSVDELCVDITAGQKVYSAAATVITLNRTAVFSYVGTADDAVEGKLFTYDASVTS